MKASTLTAIFVVVWVAAWLLLLHSAPYHWTHAVFFVFWCIGTVGLSNVVYRSLKWLKAFFKDLDENKLWP